MQSGKNTMNHDAHPNRQKAIDRRNCEADAAWQDYRRTGQFVSNADMMAWLDTWGMASEKHSSPTLSR